MGQLGSKREQRRRRQWWHKRPPCPRCGRRGTLIDKVTGKRVGCRACDGRGTSL